jgi:pimeloyl-ACP methyl ester carboxylesterase
MLDYRDAMAAAASAIGLDPPAIVVPADRFARLNGLNFHYLDWGNGDLPTVVLLHGGGLTAHTWDMAALLLRDRYHLLALDLRGHGDSDWSPDVADDTNAAMADDVAAFLGHLGRDAILVGHSMGGMAAIRYAARRNERLRALVLVDIGPDSLRDGPIDVEAGRRAIEVRDSIDAFLERALRYQPLRAPEALRYGLIHSLKQIEDGRWTWKQDRRPRPELDADAEKAARLRDCDELWAAIRAINTPTLVIRGEASRILTAEQAERMTAAMTDARFVTVANSGHSVQSNNPAGFAQALDGFLTAILGR